jgi:hypothetical protein
MYCPVCLNPTLKVAHRGVVKVSFNGKGKPTSQFIFNLQSDSKSQLLGSFEKVLDEYFSWYSTFTNQSTIRSIDLTSCDFVCSEGCKLTLNHMISVVDILFSKSDYKTSVEKVALVHTTPVELQR